MSIRCTYKIESCFETFEHQNPFECAMTTGSQILIDQLNASELADYEQFCIEKSSRKHVDIYTAFLPFNEATRALHALFPTMKELRPKQILVLWDRSCYLSRLMEAMFPEAKIYTTWEGDHDVLGKKGFAYWTRSEAPSTPKVTFCNHEKSMPCFEDSSFDLILGMDLLHRIQLGPFFNEIDRLLKPMGGAVFPHVHLSNAQPDPFFERGGVYRSGNDYQDFLNQLETQTQRKPFVQSEPLLFQINESGHLPKPLCSNPDHGDYNGLVAWLPNHLFAGNRALTIGGWQPHLSQGDDCRGLLNPLMDIDLNKGQATLNPEKHGGHAGRMFRRHPVYERHLSALHNREIPMVERKLLYHIKRGKTLSRSAFIAGVTVDEALEHMKPWIENGGLFLAPLSSEGHRMQSFLGDCTFLLADEQRTIPSVFQRMALKASTDTFIEVFGEEHLELSAAETLEVVTSMARSFIHSGIQKGDLISSELPPSAELLIVVWATWFAGGVFTANGGKIQVDDLSDFEKWMELQDECRDSIPINVAPNDLAVRLFTSGSTGKPKAIDLTHGQLVDSAQTLVTAFQIRRGMKSFVHHGVTTMSGLRNAAVLPVFSGGTIALLPGKHVPLTILSTLIKSRAQIITGNPSFFDQIAKWAIRENIKLDFIERPLCTGAPLPNSTRASWTATNAAGLLNYYGLTETTGCFIAQSPGDTDDGIGRPVAGLIDIDTETQRLRIFGDCISNSAETSSGFFDTKDRAEWTSHCTIRLIGRDSRRFKTIDEELVLLDDLESALMNLSEIEDVHAVRQVEGTREFAVAICQVAAGFSKREAIGAVNQPAIPEILRPQRLIFVPKLPRNFAGKVAQKFIDDLLN